jgi:3-methyladenine DNA glycosylase AlkD
VYNFEMNKTTTLSPKAQNIYSQISQDTPKLGDLKKIGKEIKKDHELAMQLWSTKEYYPRLLAVLILDKNLLTQEVIENLATDMSSYDYDKRTQLADWLLANQLMKAKKTIVLIETWEHHPSPILRRLFWYYQARLRWTGKTPPDNTPTLLASLEQDMAKAESEVQWAMNFTAAQIGIYEPAYRSQCIELGERLALYKDEPVARGCTPNYLPEFIRIEAAKHSK